METSLKKAIKYSKKATQIFLIANCIHICGFILGLNNISNKLGKSINNESELEERLQEEKTKLNFDNSIRISAYLSKDDEDYAGSQKIGYNKYRITLSPKYHTVATLRHELYHIYDGHCDNLGKASCSNAERLKKVIKSLYLYEPKAIIYDLTGLKL